MLLGASAAHTLKAAKQVGAFSGALRKNLVSMLEHVGLHRWANLDDCTAMFDGRSSAVQTASVLPFPVFVDGTPYNGSPKLLGSPMLRNLLLQHFVPMAASLPGAKILALGKVPGETIDWLVTKGHLDGNRVLGNLPHPSTASMERVEYFIGKRTAAQLSAKTNAAKLDRMRSTLVERIGKLTEV